MNAPDRSALNAKIAALRAKTEANGCTEAEAMSAAALAAKLMADAGLSESDLVMTEAADVEETERATWRTKLNGVIAYCTNCAVWMARDPAYHGSIILFVGREPGPEIAVYLRDVCLRAVKTELQAFKIGAFYKGRRKGTTKRQAAADFIDGMVLRLSSRLIELFGPVIDKAARANSKAVLEQRLGRGVALRSPERKTRYSAAASAGWHAGGSVALHHGVAGSAAPKLIEAAHG